MGQAIGQYISQNQIGLVKDLMICILGAVLGLILSQKKDTPSINNSTPMNTINVIIKTIMVEHTSTSISVKTHELTRKQVGDDSNSIIGWMIFLGTIGFIYSRYYTVLLEFFTGFTLFVFTSLVTLSIKLYRNNQYDRLNQWWTILGFILTVLNFINIWFMSNQDVLVTGSLDSLFRIVYYATGFIMILIPNLFILLLIVHLFAVNAFLLRNGNISMYLVRKTAWLVNAPKVISIIALVISILSMFFSSGKAYELIKYQSEKNMNVINEIAK